MSKPWRLLLFGASGAIGSAVAQRALDRSWSVVGVSRAPAARPPRDGLSWIVYDPVDDPDGMALEGRGPFDAVCWAQGANMADSIATFDMQSHLDLYGANCLSVLSSASALLRRGSLGADGARMVIVSSIWQERARQHKLSYTVTKAAVGGIVRSMAVDLGADGHMVNGVLPGVLDTPMTRANLTPAQIDVVRGKTAAGRLSDLDTLAETILFLCSADNNGITGQSITVDLGMSNASFF